MARTLRGFFAIALTPFDETGGLLWDELEKEFDWIVRAGAQGLVWPVNNSEFYTLSEAERAQGFKVLTQAVAGRIPVMAGVADTSKSAAVGRSSGFSLSMLESTSTTACGRSGRHSVTGPTGLVAMAVMMSPTVCASCGSLCVNSS